MRFVCDEKLMSIKYTRHNPITFIKGRPICGAAACKGNHLGFLHYVSKSICIQMCNAEPQQSAWLIKLALMVSAGKCCASNKAEQGGSERKQSPCREAYIVVFLLWSFERAEMSGKGLGCYFSLFQHPFAILALYKYLSCRNTHLLLTPFRSPHVLVPLGPNTWVIFLPTLWYSTASVLYPHVYQHKPVLHLNLRLHSPPSRVESCCLHGNPFHFPRTLGFSWSWEAFTDRL